MVAIAMMLVAVPSNGALPRAYNGNTEVPAGRFPWFVSLKHDGAPFRCSGSLVAPDVVLTSDTCALKHTSIMINGSVRKAIKYVVHPAYPRRDRASALIILDRPLSTKSLANLPRPNVSGPGTLTLVGARYDPARKKLTTTSVRMATVEFGNSGCGYADESCWRDLVVPDGVCGDIHGAPFVDRGSRRDVVYGVGRGSIPCSTDTNPIVYPSDVVFVPVNTSWITLALRKVPRTPLNGACDLSAARSRVRQYASACPAVRSFLGLRERLCRTVKFPGPPYSGAALAPDFDSWAACSCPEVFTRRAVQYFNRRYGSDKLCPESYRGTVFGNFVSLLADAAMTLYGLNTADACEDGIFSAPEATEFAYRAAFLNVVCSEREIPGLWDMLNTSPG
jgi:hypothetical protein